MNKPIPPAGRLVSESGVVHPTPVPSDIRDRLLEESLAVVKSKNPHISGIYLSEAAYHLAKEKWEAHGYTDPSTEFVKITDRVKSFLNDLLNE